MSAWRSAPAGGVRAARSERPAESGALAGRAGTERRCPSAGEPEPARSTGAVWQRRRSPPSATLPRRKPLPPAARTFRVVGGPGIREPGKLQRRWPELARRGCFCCRLRASLRWWYLLPSASTSTPKLALAPAPAKGSTLSPGGQAQGPVLHSLILSVGCCLPQRPASIPDLRGQAKATSLQSLERCSEMLASLQARVSSLADPNVWRSCFFSRSCDPRFLGPLGGLASLFFCTRTSPFRFPAVFRTSFFLKFLLIPVRYISPCPPQRRWPASVSSCGLPSLCFPPSLPPPDPSLRSSTPICFFSVQPHPITSFLYLSPDSQCLPRPPPRGFPEPGRSYTWPRRVASLTQHSGQKLSVVPTGCSSTNLKRPAAIIPLSGI